MQSISINWVRPGDEIDIGNVIGIMPQKSGRIFEVIAVKDGSVNTVIYPMGALVSVYNWNRERNASLAGEEWDEQGYYTGPFKGFYRDYLRPGSAGCGGAGSDEVDNGPEEWHDINMMKNEHGEYDDRPLEMMTMEELQTYLDQAGERMKELIEKSLSSSWQVEKVWSIACELKREMRNRSKV